MLKRSTRVLALVITFVLLVAGTVLSRCQWEPRAAALQMASVEDLGALGAAAEQAMAQQHQHDAEAIAAGTAARAQETARRAEIARQTAERARAAARSSRGTSRSSAAPSGGDFWARLSGCESASNSWSGRYKGYFQFSDSNVATYGITPSSSYEQQKAAAQHLAAHSDPRGQWPTCWARAGG